MSFRCFPHADREFELVRPRPNIRRTGFSWPQRQRTYLPSARLNLTRILGFWLTILVSATVTGQETPPSEPDFAAGAFDQSRSAMRELIQVQWNQRSLALGRDWPGVEEGELAEIKRKAEIQKMIDRGFRPEQAEQYVDQKFRQDNATPLQIAFNNVMETFGPASRGRSVSGSRMQLRYRGTEMHGMATTEEDYLRFEFEEVQSPQRRILIWQSADRLVMTLTGDDFLIDLRQHQDGRIRLARIAGDAVDVFVAPDFAALADQHAQAVRDYLIPMMRHFGISPPMFGDSQEIRSAVISQLKLLQRDMPEELQQYLVDLDAKSFSQREQATSALDANFEQWQVEIKNYLDTREDISLEARRRLAKIAGQHESNDEVSEFIRSRRLLVSLDYLIELLDVADSADQKVVARQLQALTREEFGVDSQAWRKWRETNPQSKK